MRLLPVFLLLVPATAAASAPVLPADGGVRPSSQVLVEIAWARPGGDLAGDFRDTELGFGARDGFELGFRWRVFLTRKLSLAPAFHFSDYGNHDDFYVVGEGDDAEAVEFDVQASSYRTTLELRWTLRDPDAGIVPYVGLGGGLYRNRVRGYLKRSFVAYDESVNTLGWQVRIGARADQLELSAVYHRNRFSTWRYFDTGRDQAYDWDAFGLRLGWIIPFE